MEGEINSFIKCWFLILASAWYCHLLAKVVPKGTTRLISLSPVIFLFFVLPLNLHTVHCGIITSYFISWLANFKLLLLAFGVGPLSGPSISLGRFALVLCFPVKIKASPHPEPKNISMDSSTIPSRGGFKSPLNYVTKALLSLMLLFINEYYKSHLHLDVYQFLMCLYIYVGSEFLLAVPAIVAQILLGTEVQPQFGEPYLSTSLKDFWGLQWNLISSDILHSTIFKPILYVTTPFFGRKWALVPAVLGTFIVSGFMHELMFYHICHLRPTLDTTLYFFLNGISLLVETYVKNYIGRWQLPPIITGPVIFGLEIIAFIRLVLPSLLRSDIDIMAMEEYEAVGSFMMDLVWARKFKPVNVSSV